MSVREDEAPVVAMVERREFRAALNELARRYSDGVYNFCARRLSDRVVAEDVTQRVFADACRDLANFRFESTLRSWLFGIANNRCRDEVKSRVRRFLHLDPEPIDVVNPPDQAPDPMRVMERVRVRTALADCLRRLKDETREAIDMHYLLERTYEDMGRVLGVEAGTLQRRVTRGLVKLRRCLESKDVTL